MKWSWAGHINRLKDDRWTSRVIAWRPYDKKIRQGRPAKRWRDDLEKYWSDTIWQRIAQDRVIWRRHAEAFAQPCTGHSGCLMIMMMMMRHIQAQPILPLLQVKMLLFTRKHIGCSMVLLIKTYTHRRPRHACHASVFLYEMRFLVALTLLISTS